MSKPPPVPAYGSEPRLEVEVVIEDDRWRQMTDVANRIQAAAGALGSRRPDLFESEAAATVLLADDAHVASLNGRFRSKPAPTNVLSFPAGAAAPHDGEAVYLGDIVLARETVEREARDLDIPVTHHLQHLTIHGLLHLIGFDHETDAEAVAMEAIETAVLATLEIADPYAPDAFDLVRK